MRRWGLSAPSATVSHTCLIFPTIHRLDEAEGLSKRWKMLALERIQTSILPSIVQHGDEGFVVAVALFLRQDLFEKPSRQTPQKEATELYMRLREGENVSMLMTEF